MERHAVHRRRHAVFANAVMNVIAREIGCRDRLLTLGPRIDRAGKVGRAADQFRHHRGKGVEHHARALPRRQLRRLGGKFRPHLIDRVLPSGRQLAILSAQEFGACVGWCSGQPLAPFR